MVAQFGPGDYVMVSRVGTQSERFKTKLRWMGPMKVKRTISRNVYELEDLLGKQSVVHATRLQLYEGKTWNPKNEIVNLYSSDRGHLEVKRFVDLRQKNELLELKVRWLGFKKDDDTWEPLLIMAEDLPELVEKFLIKKNSLIYKKARGLLEEKGMIFARLVKISRGWRPFEEEILKQAIMLFGVGRFKKIIEENLLPGKLIQSINLKTQKLVGQQSILEFSGIKLRTEEVLKRNQTVRGVDFYVERDRVIPRAERLLKKFFNIFRYSLRKPYQSGVYFYRRLENASERRDYLNYLEVNRGDGSKLSLIRPLINNVANEIERLRIMIKEDESFSEGRRINLLTVKNLLSELKGKYSVEDLPVTVLFENTEYYLTQKDNCIVQVNEEVKELCQALMIFKNSYPIRIDLRRINWSYFKKTYIEKFEGLPDVFYLDPPLRVGVANPTRGLSIGYETLTLEELEKIVKLNEIIKNGLVFLWVTKATRRFGEDWLVRQGGLLQGEIAWIKLSKSNKIQANVSGMIRSAKELLLVAKFGNVSSRKKTLNLGADVFFCPRLKQNRKPEMVYEMIEKVFNNGRLLELFGRDHNVRPNWMTLGNEISSSCSVFDFQMLKSA